MLLVDVVADSDDVDEVVGDLDLIAVESVDCDYAVGAAVAGLARYRDLLRSAGFVDPSRALVAT